MLSVPSTGSLSEGSTLGCRAWERQSSRITLLQTEFTKPPIRSGYSMPSLAQLFEVTRRKGFLAHVFNIVSGPASPPQFHLEKRFKIKSEVLCSGLVATG